MKHGRHEKRLPTDRKLELLLEAIAAIAAIISALRS